MSDWETWNSTVRPDHPLYDYFDKASFEALGLRTRGYLMETAKGKRRFRHSEFGSVHAAYTMPSLEEYLREARYPIHIPAWLFGIADWFLGR